MSRPGERPGKVGKADGMVDRIADALALVPKRLPRCVSERLPATMFALLDCGWWGCTGPSTHRSDCDRNHKNRESREKYAGEQPSNHDNPLPEDALLGSYSTFAS
jgi:hypothetical protein